MNKSKSRSGETASIVLMLFEACINILFIVKMRTFVFIIVITFDFIFVSSF